eukprot:g2790.t1
MSSPYSLALCLLIEAYVCNRFSGLEELADRIEERESLGPENGDPNTDDPESSTHNLSHNRSYGLLDTSHISNASGGNNGNNINKQNIKSFKSPFSVFHDQSEPSPSPVQPQPRNEGDNVQVDDMEMDEDENEGEEEQDDDFAQTNGDQKRHDSRNSKNEIANGNKKITSSNPSLATILRRLLPGLHETLDGTLVFGEVPARGVLQFCSVLTKLIGDHSPLLQQRHRGVDSKNENLRHLRDQANLLPEVIIFEPTFAELQTYLRKSLAIPLLPSLHISGISGSRIESLNDDVDNDDGTNKSISTLGDLLATYLEVSLAEIVYPSDLADLLIRLESLFDDPTLDGAGASVGNGAMATIRIAGFDDANPANTAPLAVTRLQNWIQEKEDEHDDREEEEEVQMAVGRESNPNPINLLAKRLDALAFYPGGLSPKGAMGLFVRRFLLDNKRQLFTGLTSLFDGTKDFRLGTLNFLRSPEALEKTFYEHCLLIDKLPSHNNNVALNPHYSENLKYQIDQVKSLIRTKFRGSARLYFMLYLLHTKHGNAEAATKALHRYFDFPQHCGSAIPDLRHSRRRLRYARHMKAQKTMLKHREEALTSNAVRDDRKKSVAELRRTQATLGLAESSLQSKAAASASFAIARISCDPVSALELSGLLGFGEGSMQLPIGVHLRNTEGQLQRKVSLTELEAHRRHLSVMQIEMRRTANAQYAFNSLCLARCHLHFGNRLLAQQLAQEALYIAQSRNNPYALALACLVLVDCESSASTNGILNIRVKNGKIMSDELLGSATTSDTKATYHLEAGSSENALLEFALQLAQDLGMQGLKIEATIKLALNTLSRASQPSSFRLRGRPDFLNARSRTLLDSQGILRCDPVTGERLYVNNGSNASSNQQTTGDSGNVTTSTGGISGQISSSLNSMCIATPQSLALCSHAALLHPKRSHQWGISMREWRRAVHGLSKRDIGQVHLVANRLQQVILTNLGLPALARAIDPMMECGEEKREKVNNNKEQREEEEEEKGGTMQGKQPPKEEGQSSNHHGVIMDDGFGTTSNIENSHVTNAPSQYADICGQPRSEHKFLRTRSLLDQAAASFIIGREHGHGYRRDYNNKHAASRKGTQAATTAVRPSHRKREGGGTRMHEPSFWIWVHGKSRHSQSCSGTHEALVMV